MSSLPTGAPSNDLKMQLKQWFPKSVVEKAQHLHSHVEGYLITDTRHHCLQHNLAKLRGVKVRVNGERGLRAKQVCLRIDSPLCASCSIRVCQNDEWSAHVRMSEHLYRSVSKAAALLIILNPKLCHEYDWNAAYPGTYCKTPLSFSTVDINRSKRAQSHGHCRCTAFAKNMV